MQLQIKFHLFFYKAMLTMLLVTIPDLVLAANKSILQGGNFFDPLKVSLMLLLVLVAIGACFCIFKRLAGIKHQSHGGIKLLSTLSLGVKERICLIEVGDKQILVSMAPSGIQTLHVFTEAAIVKQEKSAIQPSFMQHLERVIRGEQGTCINQ
jgi:flagellar protein FliO/FliZ